MRGQFVILLAGWIALWAITATGAAIAESPLVVPPLKTLFDESFATHPTDRFEFRGPISLEFSPGCLTMHCEGGRNTSAIRRAVTGPVARLSVKLNFPPLEKDGEKAETRIGLVVGRGDEVFVAFVRARQMGKVTERIQLVHRAKRPGFPPGGKVVRAYPPGNLGSGVWILDYNYGYLCVARDDAIVAQGFVELPVSTSPVMGLVLNQREGSISFHSVRLAGSKLLRPASKEDWQTLIEAAATEKKLASAYRDENFGMAFEYAMDAMTRYRQVWGENHLDTASAYSNLAMVFLADGDFGAAWRTYEQALAIQRKVLGARHPLTAKTHAKLGMLFADHGEQTRATPHLKQALAVLADVLPPEHSLMVSLRARTGAREP